MTRYITYLEFLMTKGTIILLLSSIGGLLTELTDYYLAEGMQFLAIFLVVCIDAIVGIIRSLKNGVFETNKTFKSLYRLVAFWGILALVLVLELSFKYVDWLSEAIILPILIFQIVSILKNLSQLGLIPKGVLTRMLENVDKYKDLKDDENAYDDKNTDDDDIIEKIY